VNGTGRNEEHVLYIAKGSVNLFLLGFDVAVLLSGHVVSSTSTVAYPVPEHVPVLD
jgi:hypothetical protein